MYEYFSIKILYNKKINHKHGEYTEIHVKSKAMNSVRLMLFIYTP